MIGNMMPSFGILVLASLLVFAGAGPVNKSKGHSTCAVQCSDNNKFSYKPGTVYEFSYDAKTTTKMNGASEDSAKIHMKAKVEIEPLTKCDLVMRIKDASLRDSEDQNSQAFKEAMMMQPLKFSFQDGKIEHICAMDGESTWTLNIKRGILSAFQNSMDNFEGNQNLTETDVAGSCDSQYKVLEQGKRTILVEKTKNLFGCSDREGYHMAVQSIGYNVPPFVKSLPLLKSEYKCTQKLDLGSNILKMSTCSDEHVFRPFSNGKNGALTRSQQTLTFTNKKNAGAASNEHFNKRSTLKFHHQHDTQTKQEREEKIEAKLQEICVKITENIRPEVPEMVNQLIEHMRQVDQNALRRVYTKIHQKAICAHKVHRIMEYFHDAIPMVGTAASVGMIQDLISKKHVTGSEAEMWILSLSFIHHPTKEMVAAATPLLDEADVSGNTLLSVSTLASGHCNMRPDCGKDAEISALIKKLMSHTHDCNTENADARKIILALRALGNIGHSHEAVSHLTRCATREDVHAEIRVVAMDAFRRIPCEAMRSDLMRVFRDESEDSELRLNAYIALMKCPSAEVLSEVRQVLEKEKANHVGSFVWSHLTNLMESSDSHKQELRNIVECEKLKKEFNVNQKKFSRNYEGSFFLDSINSGAKVDSNVIFSDKSFIPRSANLNLTIDLFGRAINFLEVGGRIQGIETIMQNYFGQTGVKESKKNTKDIDSSMDAFRASAYMRVFGNELRYWDDKSLNELQSSLRKLMNMQVLSFSKTMQLLDSRVIIPTCVGLPLSLTMSATGSLSLDANASLEKQKLELHVDMKPSASVQVKGEMTVDAHVTKAGLKMVTVAHTSTGLKLDILNNKFDMQVPKKMEIFNLKTDFFIVHRNTEKKQKMLVGNMKQHQICTGRSMTQVTGLTFCQHIEYPVASGDKKTPFPLFAGPIVYDLYMINEDAPEGYHIQGFTSESPYSMYMDTPNSEVSRRFAFDTVMKNKEEAHITIMAPWKKLKIEGTILNQAEMKKLTGKLSLNDRTEFALNAELGMKNTKGLWSFTPKFEVEVPEKKMTCEGKIEVRPMKTLMIDVSAMGFTANDINLKVSGEVVPKEIGLTTQLKVGKKEYYIASRLGRMETKTGFKYSPFLKITVPKKELVELTSEILYESNKKMSFDVKLDKVFSKTVAMNALVLLNAGKTKTKNILKVTFKSPGGNFRINGDVENEKNGITSRIIGNYDFGAKYSDHVTLSSKIRDLSVKNSARYMGNIALASKEHEFLNFNLKSQLAKAVNHLETKFDIQYGNPKIKTNNLKFDFVLNRAFKEYSHTYDYTMAIQHPGQKIDYRMEVHHLQSAAWPFKKFENTMTVQSASKDILKTSISYMNGKEKGLPCYKAEVSMSYHGKDIKISDKMVQLSANNYANHFDVHWQKESLVSIDSTYNKTKAGIHHTGTTVRLFGDKEMAFKGMMHATPKDYEATVSLEADPGLMSHEQVNFKAKAGVQHKMRASQMSTDASLDVAWAKDKKVSANFNMDYKNGVSLNSQLAIHTSFDVLKDFDVKIKGGWENKKFTAVATSSWNNKAHIKQDIFYAHPNHKLAYTSHVDYLGKKSDIVIDFIRKDSSFNGTMKISKDKQILIDIAASYTGHKATFENDVQLNFKVFATTGEVHLDTKYDSKKHILASNGLAKFHLPLKELRQISGSYNLKHNNDMSSIEMSYSSSMKNYKNGKMSVEVKRNLPNMLKATMDLTVNGGKSMMVEVHYKKEGTAYKVDGHLVLPDGRSLKMEGSLDMQNIAASFKTMSPEFPALTEVDMVFSFSGDKRMFNSEASLKVMPYFDTSKFEMKLTKKMFSVEAKTKHGSMKQAKATVTFEGDWVRSHKMKTVLQLNNENMFDLDMNYSLKSASDFVFNLAAVTAHKHHKEFAFEVKNKGPLSAMHSSLKLKVSDLLVFDAMFENSKKAIKSSLDAKLLDYDELKMTFVLKGNLDSMTAKIITSLAKKEVNKIDFGLKEYGRWINVKVTGPKAVNLDFNMDLDTEKIIFNMASTFTMDGRDKYEMSMSYVHLSKLLIKTSIPSFNDELLITFSGNPKAFTLMTKFNHNNQIYKLVVSNKQYYRQLKAILNTPHFQETATFKYDGKPSEMNVFAQLMHNKEKFELTFSNSGFYEKIDVKLDTPYVKPTLTFSLIGHPKKFNVELKISFNKEMYEMKASNEDYYKKMKFFLMTPMLNCDFMFEKATDMAKGAITVVYDGTNYDALFDIAGNLDDVKATLLYKLNGKEQFKSVTSIKGHGAAINAMVKMPATLDFHFESKWDMGKVSLNLDSSLKLKQKQIYKIVAIYEHMKELNAKASVMSYDGELMMTLGGNRKTLDVNFKVMPYFDTIHIEMKFTKKMFGIEMKTPFDSVKQAKATVTFEGDWVRSQKVETVLQLNNKKMFDMEMNYNLKSVSDFVFSMTAMTSHKRHKEFEFDVKNKGGMHSSFKLKVSDLLVFDAMLENAEKATKGSFDAKLLDFDELEMTFVLKGNLNDMSAKIITSLAKKEVNMIDFGLKEHGRWINAKVTGPKAVNFDFDMDLDTEKMIFNMASTFTMNGRDKYEMSTFYKHLSKLQIKTSIPSFNDELFVTFSGNLKAFTMMTKFNHNNQIYKLVVSNKQYYRQLKAILNTPYFQETASFKYDGKPSEMNVFAQLMHNKEKFELTFSNSGFYEKIDVKLDTPYVKPTLTFSLMGDLKMFNLELKITHEKDIYEMKASNEGYHRQLKFMLDTPNVDCNFEFIKSGKSFKLKSNLEFLKEEVYNIVATYEHFVKLNVKVSIPSYDDELTMTLNGDLKMFSAMVKLMHNTKKYELIVSNKDYYHKMDAQLDTPFFKQMASFDFNGDEKAFAAHAKFMHDDDLYELTVSNRKHFHQMTVTLSTPFFNDKLDYDFEGSLASFKTVVTFSHDKDEYKLEVSNEGYYRKMNAKLTTPTIKTEVMFTLKGNLKTFSSMAELTHNGKKCTLEVSNKDYYRKMDMKLVTPVSDNSLSFSLDGKPDSFKAKLNFMHSKDVYEAVLQNSGFYRDIKANLNTPHHKCSAEFSLKGDLKSFQMAAKVMHNSQKFHLTLSTVDYYREMKTELATPYFGGSAEFSLKGNLQSFDMVMKVMHDDANASINKGKYELKASTKNYFREVSAMLTTPQLGKQSLMMKITGQLKNFNGFVELKNNDDVYRSEFSLKNNRFRLSLPKWIEKVQVKLVGDWKNFQFNAQLTTYSGQKYEISAINKNFHDIKAHLHIPQLDKIDVIIKTTGNLKNGGATMKMSFGEHIFESDVKISFDGTKASVEIKPHYKMFGQSGNGRLQVDLMFEAQSYKYEFEADVEGTQVRSTASVKINPEINIMMTVDVPTLDASEMKLRIVSKGFEKTDMILNMKSPWTGTMKVFYEHNGKKGKSFGTNGYVEQDGTRLAGYSLHTEFSGDYSFHFMCDYDNSQNKFETKGNLMFQGGKTVVTLGAKTPFRFFKDVSATVEHKMQKGETNVQAGITLPNQEHHLHIDFSDSMFNALLDLNMDKKNNDKQYKFRATYKTTDQHAHNFDLEMILPERTVSFDSHLENSKHSIDMSSHLMWGKDKKVGFELMAQKGKEGKVRIITPGRTVELFGKFGVNGNHYSMVGHIIMDEKHRDQKVDIKADVKVLKNKADIDFTIKFPNQKKGMNLKTTVHVHQGDVIFSSDSEFSMDQDPQKAFKMSMKVISETKGKRDIYTIRMDARHAHSGLAADLVHRLTSAPEKYHADVEMGYLTPKRQHKVFAIRGEMHRHNHEVIMKFESPSSDTIKWNSRILKEINWFGQQKMFMYRKELEAFGKSLDKMLDDEVSKKLNLVMRSFNEDLAPIRNYFVK